ncbi:MAG: hypothetical protein JKX98_04015 [Alcanivoracaceae bacterium]|nr:hypothetical protein [Alcanivoracaceae bacterium]
MNKNTQYILILTFALIILTIVYYFLKKDLSEKLTEDILPTNFKFGIVNNCRGIPAFIKPLKMRQPAIDSKQQGHSGGLLIRDITNINHIWQHQSWLQSGYIGAFDRDNKGNIYIAPLPYLSLKKNPPEQQNQIYLIDNNSAQMSLLMKLPSKEIPNNKNPFGVMGLFYDCETHSMYVSSIAGSVPKQEKGVIYQLDLTSNQVVSKLEHIDAIGLGVFNTLKGKRLYFGSARKPHIYSVKLDKEGHFKGSERYEMSLSEIQGGDTTVAKKILFKKVANKYHMIIKETEFGFRLMAESNPNRKKYHFQYSISKDKWDFIQASLD